MTKADERPWRFLLYGTIERNGVTRRRRAPSAAVNCAAIYLVNGCDSTLIQRANVFSRSQGQLRSNSVGSHKAPTGGAEGGV